MTELILNKIINNFDFTYMFLINVLTYILIEIIQSANKSIKVSLLLKRILLVCSIIIISSIYYIFKYYNDVIILINSAILAPVSWSWIFKPIINLYKLKNNGRNNNS